MIRIMAALLSSGRINAFEPVLWVAIQYTSLYFPLSRPVWNAFYDVHSKRPLKERRVIATMVTLGFGFAIMFPLVVIWITLYWYLRVR